MARQGTDIPGFSLLSWGNPQTPPPASEASPAGRFKKWQGREPIFLDFSLLSWGKPPDPRAKRARQEGSKNGQGREPIFLDFSLLSWGKPPEPRGSLRSGLRMTFFPGCVYVIVLPGGSSPRPPFSRFARPAVTGISPGKFAMW
jgi:hypothetical protein